MLKGPISTVVASPAGGGAMGVGVVRSTESKRWALKMESGNLQWSRGQVLAR